MADSTSLVLYDPRTADPEAIALAGFLAGYGGRTREAYALDLRLFFSWCGPASCACSTSTAATSDLRARPPGEWRTRALRPWQSNSARRDDPGGSVARSP